MKKTIRDLFTQEEWDVMTEELIPVLEKVAEYPLNSEEDTDDDTE